MKMKIKEGEFPLYEIGYGNLPGPMVGALELRGREHEQFLRRYKSLADAPPPNNDDYYVGFSMGVNIFLDGYFYGASIEVARWKGGFQFVVTSDRIINRSTVNLLAHKDFLSTPIKE